MKYVFWGTPEFAAIILENLINAGFAPAAVVCNPDRPTGRKKIITAPPTKVVAQKSDIPLLQLENLDIGNWELGIKKIKIPRDFDFFVVAAYANIIPKAILDIPKLGAIGVHPSLLPKYRGASPIQSAILNGETESGVTLYLMDKKVDHGAILAQVTYDMRQGKWDYERLLKKLAVVGGELLVTTLPKFLKGEVRPKEQDHAQATFTKKFTAEDGFIAEHDLERALHGEGTFATVIDRKIRALNPEPGVWTVWGDKISNLKSQILSGKRVKLLEAEVRDEKLVLTKIQAEGKKPQSIT